MPDGYKVAPHWHPADENIVVHFRNADGSLDFTPAGLRVDGPLSLDEPIFGRDFASHEPHRARRSA